MTPKQIAERLAKQHGLNPIDAGELQTYAAKHAQLDADDLDAKFKEGVMAAAAYRGPPSRLAGLRQTLLTLLRDEALAAGLSPEDRLKYDRQGAEAGFRDVHTAPTSYSGNSEP